MKTVAQRDGMNTGSANGGAADQVEGFGVEGRTVFVRNLPYTFTDSQLQEVFSEIGPVRRSFTVKEKGADQHRGFGYVQFAVAEDAIRAVKEKDGTVLHGRKVMAKLAQRRPSLDQRHPRKEPDKDQSQRLDTSGREKTASRKPSNISENMQNKKEPVQRTSERKEEAVQEKLTPKDGSEVIKDTHKSLVAKNTEESKSLPKIEKQAFSETNLMTRGHTVSAKNMRKLLHDTSEPGEKTKKKRATVGSCKRDPNDEVLQRKKTSEKQRVARTVILGGLASPEMREAVIECAKKVGSVESIQSSLSPQELKGRGMEKDGCTMGAAAIVFTSVKAASQAVAELHQKSIGDGIVWARQLGGEGAKPRKWRIIIRNLPFSITQEKIRELFASSGFVWEAKVPRKEDGQAKGFAFASFTSKANAEKAIRDMNGQIVQKRPIAVDWAVERRAYQPSTSVHMEDDKEKLPSDIEDDETASEDEEEALVKQENSFFADLETGRNETELPPSSEEIDLAKRVFNKVVSTCLKQENVESKQMDDGNAFLTATHELKSHHSESKTADEDQSMEVTSQGDLKRTVFIKNLPFDVDTNTLKRHFSGFGKVKSTYLVLHPRTKRPKGTAFLEFLNPESAEAAIAAGTGSTDNIMFLGGISLGGRKLEVLKAVEKKSAEALQKEKLKPIVVDRRNLYLLKEGKIEEGAPAAVGVSEEDMQKRRQLGQVKAIKLKSPNFHVSRTRLAVYNVPKSFKEQELRKLFVKAVKSRATKQQPIIKQVKILRDDTKGEKSRGVAFVEFAEHEHALVALRVLNNNPETFGSDRRPIVEFAIENLQTLKKRQEQQLSASKRDVDLEGRASVKKPRRSPEILKKRKNVENDDESSMLEMLEGRPKAREHGGSDSNDAKSAKPKFKKKPKSNVDSGLKKKRRRDTGSNEVNEDTTRTQSVPSLKMQKLEANATGFRQMNGAVTVAKARNPNVGSKSQQKKQTVAQKKKGSKLESEDKLDKLVAVYREKYFSNKEKQKSTGVAASNDFKRWFE